MGLSGETMVKYVFGLVVLAYILLSVLAVSFWYLLRQDGSVLTAVSGVIGGITGYFVRWLIEKYKE